MSDKPELKSETIEPVMRDSALKRLMAGVIVSDTGCWLWAGSHDKKGYGFIGIRRRVRRAHRVSWMLAHGEIPPGLWVLHRCDTPACCNPEHLYLGSASDNNRDCVVRGRHKIVRTSGELHGCAKLTTNTVREMRRLNDIGISQADIARNYGISDSQISRIILRKSWPHI